MLDICRSAEALDLQLMKRLHMLSSQGDAVLSPQALTDHMRDMVRQGY